VIPAKVNPAILTSTTVVPPVDVKMTVPVIVPPDAPGVLDMTAFPTVLCVFALKMRSNYEN
jgi:hypothetical protein